MNTWPDVSESRPATQCISVDLPEPDGPMIAVYRPRSKSTVTSSRARTCGLARAVDLAWRCTARGDGGARRGASGQLGCDPDGDAQIA